MDNRDGIEYRAAVPEDYESVRAFLCEIGWERNAGDINRFTRMLSNSDRTVVALDHARIIGFARAVCDDEANGYITMVAVSPDKRGKGVGSKIVKTLIGDNPDIKWVLTSASESFGFWKKLGFGFSPDIMVKQRARDISAHKKPPAPDKICSGNEVCFLHRIYNLARSIRFFILNHI